MFLEKGFFKYTEKNVAQIEYLVFKEVPVFTLITLINPICF